jgi:hypothetical protein
VRPLYVDGPVVYAGRGLDLLVSRDGGRHFARETTLPGLWAERAVSSARWAERVGRLGIHALRLHADRSATAVLRGRIVHRPSKRAAWTTVHRFERGSRPLKLCHDEDGCLYYGEYFGNADRGAVHVYGSEDGKQCEKVYTFPPSTIRHVHAVVSDPYRNGHWVLTGDDDEESGLWFTGDHFQTLDRIIGDTQRARAVDIIPTPDTLIVPTDTPREQNYIQQFDPSTGRLTRVHPLPNSAFHAVRVGPLMLVSTVAEPSPVNDTRHATVHASLDGTIWKEVTALVRDVPACLRLDRFTRYPEIELVPPAGLVQQEDEEACDAVYGFGRAVRGGDGRLLRWSVDLLKQQLAATLPR